MSRELWLDEFSPEYSGYRMSRLLTWETKPPNLEWRFWTWVHNFYSMILHAWIVQKKNSVQPSVLRTAQNWAMNQGPKLRCCFSTFYEVFLCQSFSHSLCAFADSSHNYFKITKAFTTVGKLNSIHWITATTPGIFRRTLQRFVLWYVHANAFQSRFWP